MKSNAAPDPSDLALAGLCDRYHLNERQAGQLEAILRELRDDEHAPTTVREPRRAVDVHIADSLTALDLADVGAAAQLADLGAGAGFPGLALAVALPASEVRLVESQARKCQFLRRVTAAAGIDNVGVIERRVEEWPEGLGAHGAVLVRALAAPAVVLEYAAPLLERRGVLVDWRGARNMAQEESALAAAEQLGLKLVEVRSVKPFPAARDRHLHIYVKVADTPAKFPRRAGMARKRPLGAGPPSGRAGGAPSDHDRR